MKSTEDPAHTWSKGIYNFFGIIISILFGLILLGVVLLFPENQEDLVFISSSNQNKELFLSSTEKNSIEPPNLVLINQNSLQATFPLIVFSPQLLAALVGLPEYPRIRDGIVEYVVSPSDSLWSIADEFDISVNTIVWANNLRGTIIRPGQRLVILPVSGVKHIVREGDTISRIAEKYNVGSEKIIDFNNIPGEGSIFIGQSLIIPGGRKESTISAKTANIDITALTPAQVRAKFSTNNYWGQSWRFPFGQCTWWVAQKRPIGRWGHAKSWLSNAQRDGLQVCRGRNCPPQVGAVIVVKTDSPFGHVAYVEGVRGNRIIFSEMNNIDWGRINRRTVEIGDPLIIGYIY